MSKLVSVEVSKIYGGIDLFASIKSQNIIYTIYYILTVYQNLSKIENIIIMMEF